MSSRLCAAARTGVALLSHVAGAAIANARALRDGAALLLACALAAPAALALDITASHVNPPGEPTYEAFRQLSEALAGSDVDLHMRVFPRGQLGDEQDVIEQVRLGAITMASVSTAALSAFSPSVGVLDIPFLMRDHDRHPWVVADGPLGERIAANVQRETGLVVIGWWSAGMRHVFTRKTPVRGPQELAGLKIRVIQSKVYTDTFNGLGAKATPMPYGEVYTALATGTVDAAENDVTGYRNMQFFEQAPELSLTGHFFLFKPVIVNRRALEKLSAAQREAFDKAFVAATAYQRELSASLFVSNLQWLKDSARVNVTVPDREALQMAVKPVQDAYAQRFGRDFVNAIRNAR